MNAPMRKALQGLERALALQAPGTPNEPRPSPAPARAWDTGGSTPDAEAEILTAVHSATMALFRLSGLLRQRTQSRRRLPPTDD